MKGGTLALLSRTSSCCTRRECKSYSHVRWGLFGICRHERIAERVVDMDDEHVDVDGVKRVVVVGT